MWDEDKILAALQNLFTPYEGIDTLEAFELVKQIVADIEKDTRSVVYRTGYDNGYEDGYNRGYVEGKLGQSRFDY